MSKTTMQTELNDVRAALGRAFVRAIDRTIPVTMSAVRRFAAIAKRLDATGRRAKLDWFLPDEWDYLLDAEKALDRQFTDDELQAIMRDRPVEECTVRHFVEEREYLENVHLDEQGEAQGV
jgi:hypothetical protein